MAKAGRKPTPTKLKLLLGNPGHRSKESLGQDEPQPTGELQPAPDRLSESARAIYDDWAAKLSASGIGTDLDSDALAMAAMSYDAYLEAASRVAQTGAVWLEKGEGTIPKFVYSPYWSVMNREWKKVLALMAEFGMTPSSRSRVKTDKKPKSKLDEFIA